MCKGFEIDDDYCREASAAYFAEEEEMKLGIHPSQIKERIEDWFEEKDVHYESIAMVDFKGDRLVRVDLFCKLKNGNYGFKFYGIFDYIKNDFVDEEMSVKENMEFFNIKDNPFNIIAHATMEVMRTAMFSSHRYRNEEVGKEFWDGYDSYMRWMNIIEQQYGLLDKVNEKTIKFLRESSYFGHEYSTRFNEINHYILDLEKDMATTYSYTVPFRGLEYERERLGEDSREYQRLCYLINLIDKNSCDIDSLSGLINIIELDHIAVEYGWVTEDEYVKKKAFIDDNKLTHDEVDLMESYIEQKNKEYSANS